MENNIIKELKELIEKYENILFDLKQELTEAEGYQTLEDLGIEY